MYSVALLDANVPTLEAIATFLEKQRVESRSTERDLEPIKASNVVSAKELQERLVSKRSKLRDAIQNDLEVDFGQLGADAVITYQDIKELQEQKQVMEEGIKMYKLLQKPAGHSLELVAMLRIFENIVKTNPPGKLVSLASVFASEIRTKWLDKELERALRTLKATLSSAGWPTKSPPVSSTLMKDTLATCLILDTEATFAQLTQPVADRVRYNFQRRSDTARADRPDWLFSYIIKLLNTQKTWVAEMQYLIDRPLDHLISALIPVIAETCHKSYTLDSFFVHELTQFASTLETEYWCTLDVTSSLLSQTITSKELELIFMAEEKSKLDSLHSLLKSGSQKIDFDADVTCAKPTFVAINLGRLIKESDYLLRFDPEQVLHRVHFILIKAYIDWLEVQVDTYEHDHSTLARAVASTSVIDGRDKKNNAEVSDLETMARIFGSTAYVLLIVERLGVDREVATVSTVETELESLGKRLRDLKTRTGKNMAKTLNIDFQKAMKNFFRVDWVNGHTTSDSIIRSALDKISTSMSFIQALSSSSMSDNALVMVPFAQSVAQMFWRMVIQANVFSVEAARELQRSMVVVSQFLKLPPLKEEKQNSEAVEVLVTGVVPELSQLTSDQVEGLLRRRR